MNMENKKILRQLAEEKLKAFATGNMGKPLVSKKKLMEQRHREDEEAVGHVFQEFFSTFQEPTSTNEKAWIKGGVYNSEQKREESTERGRIYKPTIKGMTSKESPNLSVEKLRECTKLLNNDTKMELFHKKKEKEPKKSNLELLKEEMKQCQEEREERHKIKSMVSTISEMDFQLMLRNEMGNFDVCDPNTTNLYLGNLNPKLTESQLMDIFGKFGPLASVKIMWPRTEEEKSRGHHCGFVAFMNRNDGERALRNLNAKNIMGYELRISWGKCVPLPLHPVYIPTAFQELSMPPPFSGLPFNAQPINPEIPIDKGHIQNWNKILSQSVIKVVIPTDRKILCLIHRMIEFVIREGPLFEAMIMKKETNNPMFSFLFDNNSHLHVYYRWKLFSILQGDSQKEWRTNDFRMFEGGSIWRPPPMNIYTRGMPEHLIESNYKDPSKSLSTAQKERFQQLLNTITPERLKIADAMVFAMQHGKAADDICNCILDTVKSTTNIHKTISCVYLISDILTNLQHKIHNTSQYRRAIDTRIFEIFNHAYNLYKIQDILVGLGFKVRVFRILDTWKKETYYPNEFIVRIENMFGEFPTLQTNEMEIECDDNSDEDGTPLMDEDVEYTYSKNKDDNRSDHEVFSDSTVDADGESLDSSPRSSGKDDNRILLPIHIPSKWD